MSEGGREEDEHDWQGHPSKILQRNVLGQLPIRPQASWEERTVYEKRPEDCLV